MGSISELIGKTIVKIKKTDDRIEFQLSTDESYAMYHSNDCCESVYIEDIVGDLDDLLHSPITMAEEESNSTDSAKYEGEESWTWTYYKIATVKGYVTIRWYGSSNGYYSESVDFEKL